MIVKHATVASDPQDPLLGADEWNENHIVEDVVIADVEGLQTALDGKQPLSTVLTNTTASFTAADETKLDGIQSGATANSSDATLLNRANHTGTQDISTVTNLQTSLDAKAPLTSPQFINHINLALNSTPATPASGTVNIFNRQIAMRNIPAWISPSGFDTAFSPLLARNKIGYWCPPGNATTVPGVLGFTAPTITGFTATARNVTVSGGLLPRMRRLGYVTAATAGTVGNFRSGAYQYALANGSGLGGFFIVSRFAITDAAVVAGARMFHGVRGSSTPANVEPSTLTNCIGVGHGASDTNLFIYYGGSVAQTPIDLGANFPIAPNVGAVYELALYAPPNQQVVNYEVTRLDTGAVATGTLSGTLGTQLPAHTTGLAYPWGYRTNNATALSVALDFCSMYVETDN